MPRRRHRPLLRGSGSGVAGCPCYPATAHRGVVALIWGCVRAPSFNAPRRCSPPRPRCSGGRAPPCSIREAPKGASAISPRQGDGALKPAFAPQGAADNVGPRSRLSVANRLRPVCLARGHLSQNGYGRRAALLYSACNNNRRGCGGRTALQQRRSPPQAHPFLRTTCMTPHTPI